MKMDKTLVLYTAEFPYGKGETFLENEIPILAREFSNIIIVPFSQRGEARLLPGNCRVQVLTTSTTSKKGVGFLFRTWVNEWMHCRKKMYFLLHGRRFFSMLKQGNILAAKIENELSIHNSVHYSFWLNDWALALALLKKTGWKKQFVFRCGGFDIWDERHPGNYLPFRYTVYKQTSGVFPNSRKAEVYLKNLDIFPQKIRCAYWGTVNNGMGKIPADKNSFTVVSCSSLIPLKRVHLIAELLGTTGLSIEWVHFGDGPERKKVEDAVQRFSNIRAVFKGNVSNANVHAFYQQNAVHAFITTSSTEGLPVSVQEAASYGIPVIATNVGGMEEVVTPDTGLLLHADIDIHRDARKVAELLQKTTNAEWRNTIHNRWKLHFDAHQVYTGFSNEIKQLAV